MSLQVVPIVYYDNISAWYLAKHSVFHACTKHIKIDFSFHKKGIDTKLHIL